MKATIYALVFLAFLFITGWLRSMSDRSLLECAAGAGGVIILVAAGVWWYAQKSKNML